MQSLSLCVITIGKIFQILSLRENMQMRKGLLSQWLCITVVSRNVVLTTPPHIEYLGLRCSTFSVVISESL